MDRRKLTIRGLADEFQSASPGLDQHQISAAPGIWSRAGLTASDSSCWASMMTGRRSAVAFPRFSTSITCRAYAGPLARGDGDVLGARRQLNKTAINHRRQGGRAGEARPRGGGSARADPAGVVRRYRLTVGQVTSFRGWTRVAITRRAVRVVHGRSDVVAGITENEASPPSQPGTSPPHHPPQGA